MIFFFQKSARQGILKSLIYAPQRRSNAFVAQLDRALASGAKGRKFESCRARQVNAIENTETMVAIAQLVEPWIVIPVVVGSNPISHPILFKIRFLRRVAQLGSATGLGPVGRRFKSYLADHFIFAL